LEKNRKPECENFAPSNGSWDLTDSLNYLKNVLVACHVNKWLPVWQGHKQAMYCNCRGTVQQIWNYRLLCFIATMSMGKLMEQGEIK
jgi:hypothetical protein